MRWPRAAAPIAWAAYDFLYGQAEQVARIAVPDLVGMTRQEAEDRVGNDFKISVEDEVQVVPPSVVRSMVPKAPTAVPLKASAKAIPVRTQFLDCELHVAPPSTVWRMVPKFVWPIRPTAVRARDLRLR